MGSWHGFSQDIVNEIACAATPEPGSPRWPGPKTLGSPERDFNAHGYVIFHLPGNFSLLYARSSLRLDMAERWVAS